MRAGKKLRGFVLAAGYGQRLQPLTLFLPKPLLPVRGEPVIGHTLRGLKQVGCEAVVVNLHHLAERIPQYLGARYCGLPLIYSEEKEIQGTLGALWPQRDFLAGADVVLLVNGDSLCDWPWRALIRRHLRTRAEVTLLVHRRGPEPALGGGIGVDSGGRVVQLRDSQAVGAVVRRHLFAGAHVLAPRVLGRLREGPADVVSALYQPILRDGGRIETVTTRRRWHDLGSSDRYLAANLDWLRGRWPRRRGQSAISPLATIDPKTTVRHSVVEEWAAVGPDAVIESSILLAGSKVPAGSRIVSSIIGPGVRLTAATSIEGRMINRLPIGHQPHPQESVLGEFIYSPIGGD